MPKKSSIKELPPEILTQINRLIVDDKMSLDDLVAYLKDAGHDKSRSALGRYAKNLNEVGDKLKQSREMAAALVKEIGPDAIEGKTGRLLVEILQNLVFNHLLGAVEGEEASTPQDLMRLAKTMKDMASATKIDTDREIRLRNEIQSEVVEDAEKALSEAGLSEEDVLFWRREFLGVRKEKEAAKE